MSTPVHTISEDAGLAEVDTQLNALGVTSLAVVDSEGFLSGVITSTDLLQSGLRNATHRPEGALLQSNGRVSDVMTPDVVSVDLESSMAAAAALMVEKRVHRVFVTARGDIAGVLSTRDIMAAVEQVRVRGAVSKFMSTPVFTIRASQTIATATERLGKAHVTGLIVVDESEWPVGVFGQQEALHASAAARSTTVEMAMNPAVLTLPARSEMYNVARQARAMNARRVAVMNDHELIGIVTGIDFAKAISE